MTLNWLKHKIILLLKCDQNANQHSKRTSTLTYLALIVWTYIKNVFSHLLTMSTPVDDFLLSYSRRVISQMKIEAPPCLPSSPAKCSLMFQSCENWSLHYSTEKLCAHLWKRQPIPVDRRFISCRLFFLTPPEKGGRWWSDGETRWALLSTLSKANSIPVADLCLWYVLSNLLVQPKRSLLALFKQGGPVGSFQVFSLWDIQQRQLREQIS